MREQKKLDSSSCLEEGVRFGCKRIVRVDEYGSVWVYYLDSKPTDNHSSIDADGWFKKPAGKTVLSVISRLIVACIFAAIKYLIP